MPREPPQLLRMMPRFQCPFKLQQPAEEWQHPFFNRSMLDPVLVELSAVVFFGLMLDAEIIQRARECLVRINVSLRAIVTAPVESNAAQAPQILRIARQEAIQQKVRLQFFQVADVQHGVAVLDFDDEVAIERRPIRIGKIRL